jgi:hypothetical protein
MIRLIIDNMSQLDPKIEMIEDIKVKGLKIGQKYMPTVDEWFENIDGSYGVYGSKHIIVGN